MPGWGIALLVLVCVLIVLAVIYLVVLVSARSPALPRVPLPEGTLWPLITSCLPRLCVSAAGRTVGSWTCFPPEMPTTL